MFWIVIGVLIFFGFILYLYKTKSATTTTPSATTTNTTTTTPIKNESYTILECPENVKNNAMSYGLFNIIKSKPGISEGFKIYFTVMNDLIVLRDVDSDLHDWENTKDKLNIYIKDCDEMLVIALNDSKSLSLSDKDMIRKTHSAIMRNVSTVCCEKFNQPPLLS
jgi:hypothetical protein